MYAQLHSRNLKSLQVLLVYATIQLHVKGALDIRDKREIFQSQVHVFVIYTQVLALFVNSAVRELSEFS